MTSLSDKPNPTAREYVVAHALAHLGLRLSNKGSTAEKLALALCSEEEQDGGEKAAASVSDSR